MKIPPLHHHVSLSLRCSKMVDLAVHEPIFILSELFCVLSCVRDIEKEVSQSYARKSRGSMRCRVGVLYMSVFVARSKPSVPGCFSGLFSRGSR